MTIFDVDTAAPAGGMTELDRYRDQAVPVVTVASRRGTTPRYAGLQSLYDTYDGQPVAAVEKPPSR